MPAQRTPLVLVSNRGPVTFHAGGEVQREMAFRFAVNVVMYALCLDYKTEQAHIDYILRTRRQLR